MMVKEVKEGKAFNAEDCAALQLEDKKSGHVLIGS